VWHEKRNIVLKCQTVLKLCKTQMLGGGDINKAWKTVTENITISAKERLGYYELMKHKPWFEKQTSKLLNQRKQTKSQWLQDT
jgi:hypothetical protein